MKPVDLDPQGLSDRLALREMLVTRRLRLGVTHQMMAEARGLAISTAGQAERADNWLVSNVQGWAGALGARLVLAPRSAIRTGFQVPQFNTGPQRDWWDRAQFMQLLVDRRKSLGLSQAEVAQRLGIHKQSYGLIENRGDWMLVTLQNVAYVLGDVLVAWLEEQDDR